MISFFFVSPSGIIQPGPKVPKAGVGQRDLWGQSLEFWFKEPKRNPPNILRVYGETFIFLQPPISLIPHALERWILAVMALAAVTPHVPKLLRDGKVNSSPHGRTWYQEGGIKFHGFFSLSLFSPAVWFQKGIVTGSIWQSEITKPQFPDRRPKSI